jgi:hypothetical protein
VSSGKKKPAQGFTGKTPLNPLEND